MEIAAFGSYAKLAKNYVFFYVYFTAFFGYFTPISGVSTGPLKIRTNYVKIT